MMCTCDAISGIFRIMLRKQFYAQKDDAMLCELYPFRGRVRFV